MLFSANVSPFAGREGRFVTSPQLRERLMKEKRVNVGIRVEETDSPDTFRVSGRGELQARDPDRDDAPRGVRSGGRQNGALVADRGGAPPVTPSIISRRAARCSSPPASTSTRA